MEPVRPLRELFAALSGSGPGSEGGDSARLLSEHGHPALPDELVSEAIVNYADSAPVEVAEHLAPFVTAHSPVPLSPGIDLGTPAEQVDAGRGLSLLATAPHVSWPDDLSTDPGHLDAGHLDAGHLDLGHLDLGTGDVASAPHHGLAGESDPGGLDFGHGHHTASPAVAPLMGADPVHGGEADAGAVGHVPEALPELGAGHPDLGHGLDVDHLLEVDHGLGVDHVLEVDHGLDADHGFGSGHGFDAHGPDDVLGPVPSQDAGPQDHPHAG